MSQTKPLSYGINKMYYAVRSTTEQGGYTYGTPKRLRGARQITINAEGTNEKFYADNGVYFIADANTGKSGSVELAGLNDEALADLFGYITDANGVVLEDSDAHAADVALLFECENDGDHPTRFSMFDVKFTRPTEEHNTKEDSVSPDTITMDYEAAPCELPWGQNDTKNFVGGHLDYTEDTKATWEAWYNAVTLPSKGQ
jgi:phi13 family phage major tail protein